MSGTYRHVFASRSVLRSQIFVESDHRRPVAGFVCISVALSSVVGVKCSGFIIFIVANIGIDGSGSK